MTERERLACFQRVLHGGVSSSTGLTASEASILIEELEVEVLLSNPRRTLEAAQVSKEPRRPRDLLDALTDRLPTGEPSESLASAPPAVSTSSRSK